MLTKIYLSVLLLTSWGVGIFSNKSVSEYVNRFDHDSSNKTEPAIS